MGRSGLRYASRGVEGVGLGVFGRFWALQGIGKVRKLPANPTPRRYRLGD